MHFEQIYSFTFFFFFVAGRQGNKQDKDREPFTSRSLFGSDKKIPTKFW